ncbi:MAG: PBECR2 nuclease fold domain-containing protein [Bacteriovoracia bacterium]
MAERTVEHCQSCEKHMSPGDRALFVEEEFGRVFCSEDCIVTYFTPEIERLEREYYENLSKEDLTGDERESLADLRWKSLDEPSEVWRTKTLSGDYVYSLIGAFNVGDRTVWCINLCLFLYGEPSFLFLSFLTADANLVDFYRRGERYHMKKGGQAAAQERGEGAPSSSQEGESGLPTDGLAEPWTHDELFRARLTQMRSDDDVPIEEFTRYEACMEETLNKPDEVWVVETGSPADASAGEEGVQLFHFMKQYKDEEPNVWYIVIARGTETEDQLEVLDAFPTRDRHLVDHYRVGREESAAPTTPLGSSRLVH